MTPSHPASFPELFKVYALSRNVGNDLVLKAIQEALPCSPAFVEELQRTFASPDTTRSSIAMSSLTIVRIIEEMEGKVPEPFIDLAVQGLALGCVFVVQHPQYRDNPNLSVRDRDDAESAARDLDKDFVRVKNGVRGLVNIHLDPKRPSWRRWKHRRDVRKLIDLFKPHIQRLERTLKADFSELIERTAIYAAQNRNTSDSDSEPLLIEPATVEAQVESGSGPPETVLEPPPTAPLQVLVAGPVDAEGQRQPEGPPMKTPAGTTGGEEEKLRPDSPPSLIHGPSLSGVHQQPSVADTGSVQGPFEAFDVLRSDQSHQSKAGGSDASTRTDASARSGRRRRYSDFDDDEEDGRRSPSRSEGRTPSVITNTGVMKNVLNNYGSYHYSR